MSPDKDVDGFHPVNVGRLWLDEAGFVPATPAGVIELAQAPRHRRSPAGSAVVVGRSTIVGKPMAGLLLRENCTVTVCHSQTARPRRRLPRGRHPGGGRSAGPG